MLHEDQHTFLIGSRSFLLRMRNSSGKKKQLYRKSKPFSSENRTVYEIMRKNSIERDRPQMTVWRMRIACWIPKAKRTHTHTQTHTLGLYNIQQQSYVYWTVHHCDS